MGSIREKIEIIGVFKRKKIIALFDSGAGLNYIKRKLTDGEKVVDDIGFQIYEGEQRTILADRSIVKAERVRFKGIRIKNRKEISPIFVIMDDLLEDVIIGVELMQALGIVLDIPNERIKFRDKL